MFTPDIISNQDQAIKSLKAFFKHSNNSDPESFVKVKTELKNRDQIEELLKNINESKSIDKINLCNDLELHGVDKEKLKNLLEIFAENDIHQNLHSISIFDKSENISGIASSFVGMNTLTFTILESSVENFSTKKSQMKYACIKVLIFYFKLSYFT